LWQVSPKYFLFTDVPLFKINNPKVRNFLLKYTQILQTSQPKEELTNVKPNSSIMMERKYLGVQRQNNHCKWEEDCKCIGLLKNDQILSEK
jgi:hypothetical protein